MNKINHSKPLSIKVDVFLVILSLFLLFFVILFFKREWVANLQLLPEELKVSVIPKVIRKDTPALATLGEEPTSNTSPSAEIEVYTLIAEESDGRDSDSVKEETRRLYFSAFDDNGQLTRRSVKRVVKYKTAPLTRTIEALLSGPSRQDINKGIHSMIPDNCLLLNATSEGERLTLDFNEAFLDNALIEDVRVMQIEQIVFTATEEPPIKEVVITIEGEILDIVYGRNKLSEVFMREDFFR